MAGMNKVEQYLIDLDVSYEEAAANTFYVNDEVRGLPGLAITVEEPVVIVRGKVMPLPKKRDPEFYEALLKLNATDIVHGAYGIEGSDVVIVDTLEYDTMYKSEFEASLDAIGMALARHYTVLGKYRD